MFAFFCSTYVVVIAVVVVVILSRFFVFQKDYRAIAPSRSLQPPRTSVHASISSEPTRR